MNRKQWQQARELFEQLCDLPPQDQAERLDQSTHVSAVVSQVQRMLEAEQTGRQGQQLGQRLGEHAPQLTQNLAGIDRVGQQFGPYSIEALLARGGMGEIYRAARTDGAYQQQVAIKFVTLATKEAATRFERERQILASLKHPNIAQLIDGGRAEDSTPYLVMEFIEGVSIERYCDVQRLTIAQRIEIFLDVVAAVSTAHRQLIIHRDIKPANILVQSDGQAKLIDFGIGKTLLAASDATSTIGHEQLLTPYYAAPEQLSSQPVGTHTDSFQLGLLLDQLICGVPARPAGTTSVQQMVEQVRQPITEPLKRFNQASGAQLAAARSSTPQQLRRQLGGDLALIVKKATQIDPQLRYRHVDDLADDVRNYLLDRPVQARPPSRTYLLGKFFSRHRWAVLSTTVAITALLVLSVYSVRQAKEATLQGQLAQDETLKQQQVKDFLLDIFRNADPNISRGRDISAQSLLARAANRLDQQTIDTGTSAAIKQAIGGAYFGLGLVDEAERYLQQALADYTNTGQQQTEAFAGTAYLLGEVHQAGAQESALDYHQLALDTRLRLSDASRSELSDSLLAVARALRQTRDHDRIVAAYQRALTVIEASAGSQSTAYARALGKLGSYYGSIGHFELAFGTAEQGYAIGSKTMAENDPELAALALLLGTVASDTGRFALAEQQLNTALSMFTAIYDERHPRTLSVLANLSILHGYQGNLDALVEKSAVYRDRLVGVFGQDSPKTAYGWRHLGSAYYTAGRYADALAAHRQAAAIYAANPGEDSGARDQLFQARALIKLDQPQRALQYLAAGRELGVSSQTAVMVDQLQAEALLVLGQYASAMSYAQSALVEAQRLGQQRPQARVEALVARILMAQGQFAEAKQQLRTAASRLADDPTYQAAKLLESINDQLDQMPYESRNRAIR